MKTIDVYNLSNLPVADFEDFLELQEDFKTDDPEKNMKLQMLIITRGFKYSFKAWKDEAGKLWIIDAHQRKKALAKLRKSGFEIPPIPYELIFAKTKKEAVEEIAAYNSSFAEKNPDTILFNKYNIDTEVLGNFEINMDSFTLDASLTEHAAGVFDDENKESQCEESVVVKKKLSKHGDLWLLGNHRLLCGDSTNKEAVDFLMNKKKADLIVTDPPYNIAYEGKTDEALTIVNDSMSADAFAQFLADVYANMYYVLKAGAGIYVFHSDTEGLVFREQFQKSGLKLSQCCVWVKNARVMSRQDYHWQHEPVLYGWKPGDSHNWYGDRKQSTVWFFDKPQRNDIHPTMKPVELIKYPIANSSREYQIVVDFFGGSGSTMIASEELKRIAYTMELDPKYVDAQVYRYNALYPEQEIYRVRAGKKESLADLLDGNESRDIREG